MDWAAIASFIAVGVSIVGAAVSIGQVKQQVSDVKATLTDFEKRLETAVATGVRNGNDVAELKAHYTSIITMLGEVKADIRALRYKQ